MSKINKYISDDYQNFFDNDLSTTDPDLYNSIKLELERQQQHIELIASENIAKHLPADGSAYITNNLKYHNAFNGGEENRVHLVACLLDYKFQ